MLLCWFVISHLLQLPDQPLHCCLSLFYRELFNVTIYYGLPWTEIICILLNSGISWYNPLIIIRPKILGTCWNWGLIISAAVDPFRLKTCERQRSIDNDLIKTCMSQSFWCYLFFVTFIFIYFKLWALGDYWSPVTFIWHISMLTFICFRLITRFFLNQITIFSSIMLFKILPYILKSPPSYIILLVIFLCIPLLLPFAFLKKSLFPSIWYQFYSELILCVFPMYPYIIWYNIYVSVSLIFFIRSTCLLFFSYYADLWFSSGWFFHFLSI